MDATQALNTLGKRQLVALARQHGWQGDDARVPKDALVAWLSERLTPDAIAALPEQARATAVEHKRGDMSEVAQAIAAALSRIPSPGIDVDEVRAIVDERIAHVQPVRIVLDGDKAPVTISEHTHPLFEKILRLVRAEVNVLLVGPAGCGKSYLAAQVAQALGRTFGTLHCSAGVSEAQVTGWLLPTGDGGKFSFVPAQFARLYVANDSLFLIDEIDAADPNMATVLNGATANGVLHIPQCAERPEWKRGERVAIMAAANTYGMGADAQYVGRNQLDAATLDRFYIVEMGYDSMLEHTLAGLAHTHTPAAAWQVAPAATSQDLQALAQWVLALRYRVNEAKLRRVVSTRTLQKALAARSAGIGSDEIKADILAGWTRDERAKVGE